MLTIKKTGEDSYLVSLDARIKDLGNNECQILRNKIAPMIRPHKEITINIEGVKAIDDRGIEVLNEIMNVAKKSRCNIQFFNIEPNILTQIAGLTKMVNFSYREVEYENNFF